MNRVEELKQAILELPEEDYRKFRDWFEHFESSEETQQLDTSEHKNSD